MAETSVSLITGAGSGIGQAAAIALAQAGHQVGLVGRTKQKLEQTARMIGESAGQSDLFVADLCDTAGLGELVHVVLDRFGRLDAVANVAGDAPLLSIDQITPQIWRRCIDTNLSCVVQLTTAIWPILKKQRGGTIVNVSSLASFDPFPGFSIYAAAKVGVNMFTKCTADEGKAIGVKAVCIAPGAVETPMLRGLFDETVVPPDKTMDPAVVGQMICDCITGERVFEPGETIRVEA